MNRPNTGTINKYDLIDELQELDFKCFTDKQILKFLRAVKLSGYSIEECPIES